MPWKVKTQCQMSIEKWKLNAQVNDSTKILIITRLEREANKSYSLAREITQQVCELISSKLIVQ